VLEAIDGPADVRSLRSLVMSRLPVMDIYLVPLGGDDGDSDGPHYDRLTCAKIRKRVCFVMNLSRRLPALSISF
jgi:hypothetical protein